MIFSREPQMQLHISYRYHNNLDSMDSIVSDLQRKLNERIERIEEKELNKSNSYFGNVVYSDKKLIFEFRIYDALNEKIPPCPFETVTYNMEVCGDRICFHLSDEDRKKLESNHMDIVAQAFLDETF